MLVLTRKIGASLKIGKDITITVLGIDGNAVTVGIDAPRDAPIVRDNAKQRTGKGAG